MTDNTMPCSYCNAQMTAEGYILICRHCNPLNEVTYLRNERDSLTSKVESLEKDKEYLANRIDNLQRQVEELSSAKIDLYHDPKANAHGCICNLDDYELQRKLLAGALASMLRENWQPGPTESEIQDQLWRELDTVDDGFPLSNEKVTHDSRIAYLVSVYEGKKHTVERTGEGKEK